MKYTFFIASSNFAASTVISNFTSFTTTATITNNGILKIIDSSESKTGTISTSNNINLILNKKDLVIEGGTYLKTESTQDNYVINTPNDSKSSVTIENAKIRSSAGGVYSGLNSGTMKLINSEIETTAIGYYAYGNKIEIEGSKITSKNGIGLGIQSSTGTVKNTKVETENTTALSGPYANVTIENCNIKGTRGIEGLSGKIIGGTVEGTTEYGINVQTGNTLEIVEANVKGKTNGIYSTRYCGYYGCDSGGVLTINGGEITGEEN